MSNIDMKYVNTMTCTDEVSQRIRDQITLLNRAKLISKQG